MKRVNSKLIQRYLALFPCVVIVGPRQCGKTTVLESMSGQWRLFDLEKRADLSEIVKDPDLQTVHPRELRAISDFMEERKLPLGLVINNDERPRAYSEKIIGIPFGCL